MQALVRVQACVRAHTVSMPQNKAAQKLLKEYMNQADLTEQTEKGWCDHPGTVNGVKEKLQMRKEGTMKRERVIAYSLSQQKSRSSATPCRRRSKSSALSLKEQVTE